MAAPQSRTTPAFFWQGLLIILPVAMLVVASLISLRQDERAAEADARERATADARSLGRVLRSSVNPEFSRFTDLQNEWMMGLYAASQPSASTVFPDTKLQADIAQWERDYPGLSFANLALPSGAILADGRQIKPPDFPAAPRPPKWFRDLTPEQEKLWVTLRAGRTPGDIETVRQEFLDTKPSADAQQAVFDLLQPPEQMLGHSNFLPSETGLSFEEIACSRQLTATNARLTRVLLQSLWWHAIDRSSVLSAKLLDLAAGLTNRADPILQQKFFWMQKLFAAQSKAAKSLDSLRKLPELQPWKPVGTEWWHWSSDGSALACFEPMTYGNSSNDSEGAPLSGNGYQVRLLPRSVVAAILHRALGENRSLIPPYASAAISVEGVRLEGANEPATADRQPLLAEADPRAGNASATDPLHFAVKYFLNSRDRMLSAERRRAKMFGALVLTAAFTALTGLVSARLAFRRQWQLNEQKSNFVSSVSHELRAPIASVRLMAENLARGKISGPVKQGEYFRFIVQECRRLSSLIENVLDFSRIEQGRKQYEFEPTNVVALAKTTVQLMEPYAAEKGVRLEFHSELRTPDSELTVDGRALQQALVNLIDNAVKHSPKGETVTVGVQIKNEKLKIKNADAPGALNRQSASLNLVVSDHGPGIPAAEHEKIFERFYRLGSELRRETQGIGIGLSVVKHIVEAHGGRVRVESQPGRGSRFTIEVPFKHEL